MIYFDVTKTAAAKHHSGLLRVTRRLETEFGAAATPVRWKGGTWKLVTGTEPAPFRSADWLLTTELFSEDERPGFWEFLRRPPCGIAAVFHDAIPLKHPDITWPNSVARHPEYMKMLSRFHRVFAVSEASRRDLVDFWRWQQVESNPPVETIVWGADFDGSPRVRRSPPGKTGGEARLICVGILEPRKNQAFLVDVCERLRARGLGFRLSVVGRINPHFGPTVLKALKDYPGPEVQYAGSLTDSALQDLYERATASLFPTIAEGCGLPLLESLWRGVPCVCSDLPVLRENAEGGGCVPVPANDADAWATALAELITRPARRRQLADEISGRALPTWAEAATRLRAALA